ncbi:hypothetical protein [Vibrio sp. F13]|uniref:hypothetical protein n=1 Tax=Vibrio sp. F13 TaxID=2070777 RepID=UPI00148344F8|nr:hypothetical protein [Vibrio sp. F13]
MKEHQKAVIKCHLMIFHTKANVCFLVCHYFINGGDVLVGYYRRATGLYEVLFLSEI